MRSISAVLSAVFLSVAIASCAAPTTWTKPETTSAQRRADLASCRRAAGSAVDRRFGGAAGADDSGGAASSFQASMVQHDAIRYGDKLIDECMVSKGYSKQRR